MNIHPLATNRARSPLITGSDTDVGLARVLVVEQHAATAEMTLLVLATAGYDAAHTATGNEALEAADDWHPDLVLLDPLVPDLAPNEVCLRMRQKSTAPIMIVSTENEASILDLAMAVGARDYLRKPFRTIDLLSRIHARLHS
ncbi:response regulator [Nocardia sp. NPDC048505]|uniref:response regulator n=1 Tax=unclassified Nocardia TaxID=2637762 RepID=UPI00340525EE